MSDHDPIAEQERFLIQAIEALQRDYQRQAEPYIRRLAMLRTLRPQPLVFLHEVRSTSSPSQE